MNNAGISSTPTPDSLKVLRDSFDMTQVAAEETVAPVAGSGKSSATGSEVSVGRSLAAQIKSQNQRAKQLEAAREQLELAIKIPRVDLDYKAAMRRFIELQSTPGIIAMLTSPIDDRYQSKLDIAEYVGLESNDDKLTCPQDLEAKYHKSLSRLFRPVSDNSTLGKLKSSLEKLSSNTTSRDPIISQSASEVIGKLDKLKAAFSPEELLSLTRTESSEGVSVSSRDDKYRYEITIKPDSMACNALDLEKQRELKQEFREVIGAVWKLATQVESADIDKVLQGDVNDLRAGVQRLLSNSDFYLYQELAPSEYLILTSTYIKN
jgi:hypothetical protein